MYLDRILGSKTKVNALAVLIENPQKKILEMELAKDAGSSVSEINRQMGDLVNSGLVSMERVGKAKIYQINQSHFLYRSLKSLFRNLQSVYREIALKASRSVVRKHKVQAVILFGSLAKGRIRSDIVREPSDIDILVLTLDKTEEVKADLLDFVGTEISSRYGIAVYPIVMPAKEYVRRLKDDPLIIEIDANGEVMYGEKPRRFG
jgi:predicted nucleotidyltransferase